MKTIIGLDIGGSSIKVGRFDSEGTLIERSSLRTRLDDDGAHILKDAARAVKDDDIAGVGIGVPGPVKDGFISGAVNLGWGTFNVRETFLDHLGRDVPVYVENDASIAGYGEYTMRGRPEETFVFLTLGTGIGGAIIEHGRLIRGAHGAAGEFGHMKIAKDGPLCGCGKRGCLETFAGSRAMHNRVKALKDDYPGSALLDGRLNAAKILRHAPRDALAERVVEEAADAMGRSLSLIIGTLDPDRIVFGGGLAEIESDYLERIRAHYERYRFLNVTPVFETAKLGNDAGIYGAMGLLRND